ncbi:MAG: hypothetical protein HY851_01810, partial [candidate division Zixibacteria bacterium]|nr:hypothetical protein [candidate division Zixibacteria bacterium]
FANTLRQIMTASGYDEIMGHGLADSRLAEAVNPNLAQVKIINPIAEDLNIMRNSLIVTALTTVNHNLAHRNIDLQLFELGAAYFPPGVKGDWYEEDRLMLLVTGSTPQTWRDRPRPTDFYDLKGALDTLLWRLGLAEFEAGQEKGRVQYRSVIRPCFEKSQSFEILAGSTVLGVAGLVNQELLKKFDIKQPVCLAELTVSALLSCRRPLTQFAPLPVYPAAPRDLALVVDETVTVGQIVAEVQMSAGQLAESVNIFDLYKGKPIPEGRKSVGITIVYRSAERSLSGEEIEQAQKTVVGRLKSKFNAELREQ